MPALLIYLLEWSERRGVVQVIVIQWSEKVFRSRDNLLGIGPLPNDFLFMPGSTANHECI